MRTKDVEKMFKSLIIEITNFLENYEESETVDIAKVIEGNTK